MIVFRYCFHACLFTRDWTSFPEYIKGGVGFSWIPHLHAFSSPNPHLLLPTKLVVGYAIGKVGLAYLSGVRANKIGSDMMVIFLQAGRRR